MHVKVFIAKLESNSQIPLILMHNFLAHTTLTIQSRRRKTPMKRVVVLKVGEQEQQYFIENSTTSCDK